MAEELNIRSRYLEGIEEEDFSNFPADVYARGFIRRYAEYLELDADALVMQYVLRHEETDSELEEEIEYSYFLYWSAAGLVFILSIFMILLRFAWIDVDNAVHRDTPASPPVQAEEEEENNAEPAAEVEEETGLNLRVETREKTWLYAIFDGVRSREMMLRPGDTLTWEAEDTVRLRLGNAGGIQLYYRGSPLPLLGQSGEVTDKIITLEEGQLKVKTVGGETQEVINRH